MTLERLKKNFLSLNRFYGIRLIVIFSVFWIFAFAFGKILELFIIKFLKTEELALQDLDFTDIYYYTDYSDKDLKKNSSKPHYDDIVLINSGTLSQTNTDIRRKQLADVIYTLQKYNPKAIGIDMYFTDSSSTQTDSLLYLQLKNEKVVVGTTYHRKEDPKDFFRDSINFGYLNLPDGEKSTMRNYYNYIIYNKRTVNSFGYKLATYENPDIKSQDPIIPLKFYTRGKGYYNAYNSIDSLGFPTLESDFVLFHPDRDFLKNAVTGKIVIIGHMGTNGMYDPFDIKDRHRVPTDSIIINREPVMPGVVIHANAVLSYLKQGNNKELEFREANFFTYWPTVILMLFIYLVIIFIVEEIPNGLKRLNIPHGWSLSIGFLMENFIFFAYVFLLIILGVLFMASNRHFNIGKLLVYLVFLKEFKGFAIEMNKGLKELCSDAILETDYQIPNKL